MILVALPPPQRALFPPRENPSGRIKPLMPLEGSTLSPLELTSPTRLWVLLGCVRGYETDPPLACIVTRPWTGGRGRLSLIDACLSRRPVRRPSKWRFRCITPSPFFRHRQKRRRRRRILIPATPQIRFHFYSHGERERESERASETGGVSLVTCNFQVTQTE